MTYVAALLAATMMTAGPAAAQPAAQPWQNTKLSPDERARLLLNAMSLDEKIALFHGPMAVPWIPGIVMPKDAIGSAGYIAGNSRLGIPALQETDASLGIANPMLVRGPGDMSTPLPSGMALAATFDPAIAFAGGAMIANEARAKGLNVLLAGGVNLTRDPRGGRNFEYVGEDPLLAGIMAGESIRGIQSVGMISTVKHYALNGQEHERMTADSVIGEAAARESDLLAFEIAIERGQPGSVMCSYNLVNGVYGCQNDWTLNQVLKRDWGYKGFVMSDWGAVHTVDAFAAGLDQQSGEQLDKQIWFDQPLKAAVTAGTVPQARIDDAALRILRAMIAHGLIDNPPAKAPIDFAGHAKIAQDQAEGGIVLLDNRKGLLPLVAGAKRIAVIGGHAESGVPSGGGSSQVANPYHEGPFAPRTVPIGGEGMMAMMQNVVFDPSSPLAAIRARAKTTPVSFDTGIYPEAAAAAAKQADVAIVFVYQPSSEGDDVPNMALPFGQDALIEAVAAANPNTIVVLETGNPVRMPWAGKVAGVMQAWYAGAKGGEAIARMLFGEVNPSGRLPISWPVDESQLPRPAIPGWGGPAGAPVKVDYNIEGSDVGYRWYARQGIKPRYPFGFGLSYTSFRYANLAVKGGKTITASFDVTNTGAVAGRDVPQVYLTIAAGRKMRRLIGFEKVALAPGETRRITVTADPRLLASFDTAKHGWRIDPGSYRIGVGPDAEQESLWGAANVASARLKP
jgi:beta-glucosidase